MEEFGIFLGKKRVLWPFGGFLVVLWVFDGNMVGKWTNEPCNGADEAVNHFWVLTVAERASELGVLLVKHSKPGSAHDSQQMVSLPA